MSLQSIDLDILKSLDMIRVTCTQIEALISGPNSQQTFNILYSEYLSTTQTISSYMNRKSFLQGAEYQIELRKNYISALSAVKEDLLSRCGRNEKEISVLREIFDKDFSIEKLESVIEKFGALLGINNSKSELESVWGELESFKLCFPELKNVSTALANSNNYPQLQKIFMLISVATSSNATSERNFSGLRRIKTFNRATMSEERLSSISVATMNNDILPSPEEVFNRFLEIKSRKVF